MRALNFQAGRLAMAQIAAHGLRAQDIAIVPAAADASGASPNPPAAESTWGT